MDAKGVAIAAHQLHLLVGGDAAEPASFVGDEHQAGVARQVARFCQVEDAGFVQLVKVDAFHLNLGHAGESGLDRKLGARLFGAQPDGGRLDAHRQVLGDQGDVVTLVGQVAGDGQDARVVVAEPETGRQRGRVGVVQLHPQRAADLTDRERSIQGSVLDPQVVEETQRGAGEVAEFGMVPLRLQLGDDDDRDDDLMLVEPRHCGRVGQKDAGVENVGAWGCWGFHRHEGLLGGPRAPCASPQSVVLATGAVGLRGEHQHPLKLRFPNARRGNDTPHRRVEKSTTSRTAVGGPRTTGRHAADRPCGRPARGRR